MKNIEKAIMATVIQPSVWDLWWKIAIYHDNANNIKWLGQLIKKVELN